MDNNQEQATESKKGNALMPISIAVIVAIVGVGVWLSQKPKAASVMQDTTMQHETTTQPTDAPKDAAVEGSSSAQSESNVQIVAVEAGSFYFKPNEIHVKKGQKVKIVMTSKDMMHNFVVDELNIKLPITKGGETSSVEFTADKVGEFEYYCGVGSHRQRGQVGKLFVE
jgi:cytochrome c oxidase subunit 2